MPESLEQARLALQKGHISDAEALFRKVLIGDMEKRAKAAFQPGHLAEGRIDYRSAFQYYKQAADLQPDNPIYLIVAGRIDYLVGRYSEAEPLFRRAVAIVEKALGPEHTDLARCALKIMQTCYET